MYAVTTVSGKVIAVIHGYKRAKQFAIRRQNRKGITLEVVPWNG